MIGRSALAIRRRTGARAVQLLAPLRPDSPIARFLERGGPGVQQLAYTVADIDTTCAALRARGLRLLYDEPRRGHRRIANQLRAPQGRRGRAGGARRTRA